MEIGEGCGGAVALGLPGDGVRPAAQEGAERGHVVGIAAGGLCHGGEFGPCGGGGVVGVGDGGIVAQQRGVQCV